MNYFRDAGISRSARRKQYSQFIKSNIGALMITYTILGVPDYTLRIAEGEEPPLPAARVPTEDRTAMCA